VADLTALQARVRQARQLSDREAGAAQQLALSGKRVEGEVAVLRASVEQHERVTALLAAYGEQAQTELHTQVEELVTRGLQVVFGPELSFRIIPSVKASRAELDFVVRSVYNQQVMETTVMDARGGGLVSVVAFILQLVVLLLTPGARRTMWLDEPFAHLSAEYEPRMAEFLREVCSKADVQITMITHSDVYGDVADYRYRLRLGPDGMTSVEER
jgi:predicted ATPase